MMRSDSCEYCDGRVRDKRLKEEVFMHPKGPVLLEDVTLGVCDKCGNKYYPLHLLKEVEAIATGKKAAKQTRAVPVLHG